MIQVLSPDELMVVGLQLAGFDINRQNRCKRITNLNRFKKHYGSLPVVYSELWSDLQTTTVPGARIDASEVDVESFLLGLHFLRCYPTNDHQEGMFKICMKTARKWSWYFVEKIAALKDVKVRAGKTRGIGMRY